MRLTAKSDFWSQFAKFCADSMSANPNFVRLASSANTLNNSSTNLHI